MSILIGIAGGSASGKTTLAHGLMHAMGPDRVLWLLQDSYYRELRGMSFDERCLYNFDHPSAFETDLLCRHLDELLAGRPIELPEYDYCTHMRKPAGQLVESREIILLDGILVLHEPDLRKRMSLKVFVECPADVRLARRIERDVVFRARAKHDVIRQFNDHVEPMHRQFVEPSKSFADIVIPFGAEIPSVTQMVAERIQSSAQADAQRS